MPMVHPLADVWPALAEGAGGFFRSNICHDHTSRVLPEPGPRTRFWNAPSTQVQGFRLSRARQGLPVTPRNIVRFWRGCVDLRGACLLSGTLAGKQVRIFYCECQLYSESINSGYQCWLVVYWFWVAMVIYYQLWFYHHVSEWPKVLTERLWSNSYIISSSQDKSARWF